jgi:hypothetical protein
MPTMKFGKYQGYEFSEIPLDYIEWMLRDAQEKVKLCEKEIELRKNKAEDSWMSMIVERGYAALHALDPQQVNHAKLDAAYKSLKGAIVEVAAQPKPKGSAF